MWGGAEQHLPPGTTHLGEGAAAPAPATRRSSRRALGAQPHRVPATGRLPGRRGLLRDMKGHAVAVSSLTIQSRKMRPGAVAEVIPIRMKGGSTGQAAVPGRGGHARPRINHQLSHCARGFCFLPSGHRLPLTRPRAPPVPAA